MKLETFKFINLKLKIKSELNKLFVFNFRKSFEIETKSNQKFEKQRQIKKGGFVLNKSVIAKMQDIY